MSTKTVDERVVDMQFNNSQFQSGIKDSLDSIDKLKKGLDFKDAGKSFDGLSESAKRFSLSGIAEGVETIASKFTALGIIGVTALQNIANSAINAGKQLLNSLIIEPISDGFKEYELTLNAIQTTMSGTGKTAEEVAEELKRLDQYADDTIYSTADMLSNLPKFTNAGVDLNKAVTAMIGIANATAIAGGDASKASMAFYNLGQSIGTGWLTRMDFNSINNAGIATMEWKNRLVEAAMAQGTLVKEGEDLYRIGNKTYTLQSLFIDGLQHGWASADALMTVFTDYGDVTTDIGKRAQSAAQDLKTFTMMMDSLKATAGTGWKDTWELLFGDLNEAKVMWTELGGAIADVIQGSAKARNGMLQVWKDNGGRDSMIQSFRNLAEAVGSILEPIQGAFREVFPAMTGERLAEITKTFERFTEKLKIGEETATKVKKAFKGFFAFLDIGKRLFSTIAGGAKDLVVFLLPAAKALLGFSGSIGDWIVSVDDAIKTNDSFQKALEKIKTFVVDTAKDVKESFKKMIQAFEDFSGIDLSSLDAFLSTVKEKFHPLETLSDLINKAFTAITNVFKKVGPVFSKVGTVVGNAFKNMNLNGLVQLFAAGGFASIIVGVKKLIDSFKQIADNAGGFLESITSILDGVRDCLKAYENDLKAGTLLKIAAAIGILALSLMTLSMIDANKLTGALTAITVLFGELMGTMAVFDKILASGQFKSITKVSIGLILLSTSVLILANAVSVLGQMSWEKITRGLLAMTIIIGALVAVSKTLSTQSAGMIKTTIALLGLSAVVKILATAVESLGNMDTSKLVQGLLGLVSVLAMLVAFTQFVKSGLTIEDAVGLVAIAVAVRLIASAIQSIGEMDVDQVIMGILGITAAMGELILFTKMVENSGGFVSTAAGLVIFGVAMLVLASAIEKLGSMPIEVMVQGLLGMIPALTGITLALNLMPKDMIAIGVGLLAVSAGLVLMATALTIMGGMSWEEIGKGLLTLGASLLILVVATNAMTGALAGAAAILVVSIALMALAVALNLLGSMSLESIGLALLALIGTLAIFGGAALLMTPIIPIMLALAAALLLLGVAMLAIGAGMIVMGVGLATLAASGMMGVLILLSLSLALAPLILLSPGMLVLGAAMLVLAVGLLAVGGAMTVMALGIGMIMALGPAGVVALVSFAAGAAEVCKYSLELLAAGAALTVFGVGAVVAGVAALVAAVGILAIALALKLLQSVDFTKFEGIGAMAKELLDASGNLLLASPGLLAGGAALTTFGTGAQNAGDGLSSINESIMSIVTLMQEMPDYISRATSAIIYAVNSLISQITSAIKSHKSTIESNIVYVLSAAITKVKTYNTQFKTAGMNLASSLADGIRANTYLAVNAAVAMAEAVTAATNGVLEIHSPSRVFGGIGKNSILGFVNEFTRMTPLAVSASTEMARQTFEPVLAMSNGLMLSASRAGNGLQRMAERAMTMSPTFVAEKETVVRHTFDPLRVEGVNDRGEFVAAADYSVEQMLATLMRRQNRI